jgi:phosphate transport system permease protein
LGLLVLPIIIVTTREAIRTIPIHIREASYGLGSTKWQTVWNHILPYSSGGILTGVVIALSRAIGETAPLLTVGALTFIAFLPTPPVMATPPYVSSQWLFDPYTVMPIQMFNWVSRPQEEFHVNAAAAGLVLLTMTLLLNATAIYIRYRFRRKYKW